MSLAGGGTNSSCAVKRLKNSISSNNIAIVLFMVSSQVVNSRTFQAEVLLQFKLIKWEWHIR